MLKDLLLNKRDIHDYTVLVLDFETTNINFGDPREKDNSIVLSGYSIFKAGECIKEKVLIGNEYEQDELVEDIERADFCVAHNAKFEIGWLARCGLPVGSYEILCTQVIEYVILGNRKKPLDLDSIAERRGIGNKDSFISLCIKGGVCPSIMPQHKLAKYCLKDVELTYKVFCQQMEEIYEKDLQAVLYTRTTVTPVLSDIESKGMRVDKDKVYEAFHKYQGEYDILQAELDDFTGGINLNSPKQVAEFIYEQMGFSELKDRRGNAIRSPVGNPKTDTETIGKLKAANKQQRHFLDLLARRNKANALLTKNLNFFLAVVEELPNQTFYANLNQTIAGTHRLTSTGNSVCFEMFGGKSKGIQFQNIPRIFKQLFVSKNKGWLIGEVDYAQLEFRSAVFQGGDRQGLEDIKCGVDVHTNTADALTENGEPTGRQDAKSRTFKPLYGGTSGTKAEQAYYRYFKDRYKGVADAQEVWKDTVERTKQLRIASGLIFYWPDTKWEGSAKNPYLRNTTNICNYPVQSFATADIVQIGLVFLWQEMKRRELKSYIVNTIHDSMIIEVCPGEEKILEEIMPLCLVDRVVEYLGEVYELDFNVPLEAELKIQKYWSSDK